MTESISDKSSKWGPIRWKLHELYQYRNMIRAQVSRNLFGRYKNSYLGFAWNFITPIIYMILSYIVFTEIRSTSINNFIVFLSSGIFVYSMLVSGITSGGSLFTGNTGMIKKMYFPKEILAISNAISSTIVATIGYVAVLIAVIVTNHGINPPALLFVIPILALSIIFYMGCNLLIGSITVYVRDIQYFLGSISMAFFVCTPIRTMMSDADGILSVLYRINPITYFVEPMHQAIYLCEIPDLWIIGTCTIIALSTFFLGYIVFLRLKRGFVERL